MVRMVRMLTRSNVKRLFLCSLSLYVIFVQMQATSHMQSLTPSSPAVNGTSTSSVVHDPVRRHIEYNPKKRYIQRPWSNDSLCSNFTIRRAARKALDPVALASYPGSGNTWVRYLIETATGITSGSIYKDANLYFLGFWGELCSWDSGETIVQKTHDGGQHHILSFSNGTAIFVLRNPYDAILSFHNFLYGGHMGHAPKENFYKKEWQQFVDYETRHWLTLLQNWTTYSNKLLVLHYESLIDDPISNLRRALRFLQIPVDEGRLNCIKKYPRGKFKRRSGSSFEEVDPDIVFPKATRARLDRAVRYADHLIRKTVGDNPGIPFHLYRFYDDEQSYQKKTKRKETTADDSQNDRSLLMKYVEWSPRLLSLISEDPLMLKVSEESKLRESSPWKIDFDRSFPEAELLDRDFNAEP